MKSVNIIRLCLGPRINAAGRVGDSKLGATLLINDKVVKFIVAEKLNYYNQLRKKLKKKLSYKPSIKQIIIVRKLFVHSKDWHPGVIGIVVES